MRVRSILLFGAVLATAAFAAQDAVTFERKYGVGDKDTYNFKTHMVTNMGDIDLSMVMAQSVKKVYDNGDADIETEIKDMKIDAMGQKMSPPAPPATTQRITKFGIPVGKQTGGSGGNMSMNFSFMRFAGYSGGKPMKVGEEIKIDETDKDNPKNKVSGTVKLESITDGVALVVSNLQITTSEIDTPLKMNSKVWMQTASSKMVKMEGKVDGFEAGGMKMDSMTFSMEHAK